MIVFDGGESGFVIGAFATPVNEEPKTVASFSDRRGVKEYLAMRSDARQIKEMNNEH